MTLNHNYGCSNEAVTGIAGNAYGLAKVQLCAVASSVGLWVSRLIAYNGKSISELRLYAKIFSEQFINAVLYDVAIK